MQLYNCEEKWCFFLFHSVLCVADSAFLLFVLLLQTQLAEFKTRLLTTVRSTNLVNVCDTENCWKVKSGQKENNSYRKRCACAGERLWWTPQGTNAKGGEAQEPAFSQAARKIFMDLWFENKVSSIMGEDHKSISRSDKAWELPLQPPVAERGHEPMFLWGQFVNPSRPSCPLISAEEPLVLGVGLRCSLLIGPLAGTFSALPPCDGRNLVWNEMGRRCNLVIYVYTDLHMHACIHTQIYIHIYLYIYIHVHTHTYIYQYRHIHIYIYTQYEMSLQLVQSSLHHLNPNGQRDLCWPPPALS